MCNSPKKFVTFWNGCCGDLIAVIRAPFLSNDNRQGFIDSAGPVPDKPRSRTVVTKTKRRKSKVRDSDYTGLEPL